VIRQGSAAEIVLRLLIAVTLLIDAAVHFHLAPGYQLANAGGIGQGNLFYIESGVALIVAVYLIIRGSRPAYFAALIVAGSAFAAVLVTTMVAVPAIGPLPAMYEPVWYGEKTLSAVAEALGAALSVAGLVLIRRPKPARGDQ
jgi:hypothetical protein